MSVRLWSGRDGVTSVRTGRTTCAQRTCSAVQVTGKIERPDREYRSGRVHV